MAGHWKPDHLADVRHLLGHDRVGDMHAVPGHEEVHVVHGSDGNVGSVGRGFAGDDSGSQNLGCRQPRVGRDIEQREFPASCFIDDEL